MYYRIEGGDAVFAPIHNIQSGVPTENIVTMYEIALEYGRYWIGIKYHTVSCFGLNNSSLFRSFDGEKRMIRVAAPHKTIPLISSPSVMSSPAICWNPSLLLYLRWRDRTHRAQHSRSSCISISLWKPWPLQREKPMRLISYCTTRGMKKRGRRHSDHTAPNIKVETTALYLFSMPGSAVPLHPYSSSTHFSHRNVWVQSPFLTTSSNL